VPAPICGPHAGSGRCIRRRRASGFVADTLSIAVMEIVDNTVPIAIPGAMDAGLTSPTFWLSLAFALAVAFVVTVPVNRWLIARGRGHAVVPLADYSTYVRHTRQRQSGKPVGTWWPSRAAGALLAAMPTATARPASYVR
jgi:hypothetical protein